MPWRQQSELTALMATSFLDVHHAFDRDYGRTCAIDGRQSSVESDDSAIPTISDDRFSMT